MYKIARDRKTVAITEAPNYIRRATNGCFNLCQEAEAEGIVHGGKVFHLLGRPDIEGAVATVMLEETDAGNEITRAAETGGIMRRVPPLPGPKPVLEMSQCVKYLQSPTT